MRAALLPAGSDPFLIAYWLRNYLTWADQVHVLRIIVCGQEDPAIQEYLKGLAASLPHVVIKFIGRTDHGAVIRMLVEETNADTVMLCEDDAFVRKPEKIGECFSLIESGAIDLVGCPRSTGSTGILNWANSKYGWQQADRTGEAGPIYWPCFLFAKLDDLLKTDRHFGSFGWPAGSTILGQTFPNEEAMDTFGWASLQLRDAGVRVRVEPNYRAELHALTSWTDAPWFHVGSLSTGYGLHLLGPSVHVAGHEAVVRSDPYDWQKRMSWWKRVVNKWDGALEEPHRVYAAELDRYIAATQMNPHTIAEWMRGFDALITWKE